MFSAHTKQDVFREQFNRLIIYGALILLGIMLLAQATGALAKSRQDVWMIGAQDVNGVRYKMADGPWTGLTECKSPILFPASIKSGTNGLRLDSQGRTIDLAPNTLVNIKQSSPDRLTVDLEEGAVIYDLKKTGGIEINVANQAQLAAEAGPNAFAGQDETGCIGGMLYQKPATVRARNLQGTAIFKEISANRQHDIDAGNLLCMDLNKNTVTVEDDSPSVDTAANGQPANQQKDTTVTLKRGEIRVRNLQGTVTYTEPNNQKENPVKTGCLFIRNLYTRKDSTREDTIKIKELTKEKDQSISFLRIKSPWEILFGGAVGRTPDQGAFGGGEAQTDMSSACVLITEKPEQVEYRIGNGPFIRPKDKITTLEFPLTIKTDDVTICLKGKGFLLEIAPKSEFWFDGKNAEQLAGRLENGAVFYELQPGGSIEIDVRSYAKVQAESAPRVFAALPETGCVGGVHFRETMILGFFGDTSPWIIGAGAAVLAGGGIAIIAGHHGGGGGGGGEGKQPHHENHDVSPSDPE